MFNSIAYSQDTSTPPSQKSEIAKGLIGYKDCVDVLEEAYTELDVEKKLNNGYKVENTELVKENAVFARGIKRLKSEVVLWKILGFSSGVVGFYMGTRI